MNRKDLSYRLQSVANRIRRDARFRLCGKVWIWFAIIGVIVWTARPSIPPDVKPWMLGLGLLVLGAIGSFIASLLVRRPNEAEVARRVEQQYPDLKKGLLAAVEQRPQAINGRLNYLQEVVINHAVSHGRANPWDKVVSSGRMLGGVLLSVLGVTACFASAIFLMQQRSPNLSQAAAMLSDAGEPSPNEFGLTVEPGDTDVERDTSLLVLARFQDDVPGDVFLRYEETGGTIQQFAMTRSLDDAVFAARIPAVRLQGSYRVEFDDKQSDDYQVTVFEFPKLDQSDAVISYPEYTELATKTVEDTRRVTVVEGSNVKLMFRLNKPVLQAQLQSDDGTAIELQQLADSPSVYVTEIEAAQSRRFTLLLKDSDDRENRFPPEISLTVVRNKPPQLKLTFPGKDMAVSPVEELETEAKASDDFGLKQYGLFYGLAGEDTNEIVLGENSEARKETVMTHILAMEDLEAEPDELVSYYFFAEDIGPDGKSRRTFSDMYFAEVRHFDEIFREGRQQSQSEQEQQQQQQQEQGEQAQKAQELAELQKQIINATWKLIRTDATVQPDQYLKDVALLGESQQTAIGLLDELAGELDNEKSKAHAAVGRRFMEQTIDLLAPVDDVAKASKLVDALSTEQAAYQALLKLRAIEHEVQQQQQSQQQQQQSQQQRNSRSQQQLNQLELSNKENRYETQKDAQEQSQQAAENREELQVLNRLRDLARRQDAINEKLKELESELRQADTEKEKEEIARQLKTLREEQQQMLRDVDELADRMDQSENQAETADVRQQLEETRTNVREASEALEEGKVSKALSETTRAERELKDLTEEFRKRTANQFADTMKEMRNDARELADREEKLSERMAEQEQSKSLRYDKDRTEIEEGLKEQKQRVEDLENRMRETVQEAESNEPLLAKNLYDTIRQAQQKQPKENLDMAGELLKRGFLPQAGMAEQQARKGIDNLREGIERAAEGVLGDEVEALKRARQQLDQLANELGDELAEADPSQAPRERNGDNESTEDGQQNGQPRQGTQPGQQPGNQPGQPREGQPDEGQQAQQGQAGNPPQQREGQEDQQQQPGNRQQPRQGQQQGQPQQGQQPGQQPGEEPNPQGQPGQQPGQQEGMGQQPGEQPGQGIRDAAREEQERQQQGRGQGQGQPSEPQEGQQPQPGQGQPGQQPQEGQQPGQGQQPGEGERPGQQPQEGQPGQPGQQPQEGQQPGRQPGEGQRPGQQPGQQPGQGQPGQQPQQGQPGRQPQGGGRNVGGGLQQMINQNRDGGPAPVRPLTGADDFRDWSDRLRDVEEMVDDPDLRAEAARLRDRARSIRVDFKRHSKEPNWDLVRTSVFEPLRELQNKVADDIAKRDTKKNSLVPIDRDPVPDRYSELVRRYYEELGKSD